jgi:hypothetical protein
VLYLRVVVVDISQITVNVLLTVVIALFTAVGGLGGGLYFSYFAVTSVVGIALAYFIETVYNPANQSGPMFPTGNIVETLYNTTSCLVLPDSSGNLAGSALTFRSYGGLLEAVLIVLCKCTTGIGQYISCDSALFVAKVVGSSCWYLLCEPLNSCE